MTITSSAGSDITPQAQLVTIVVDGVAIQIPKGTLVIRAAELLGIEIPRFCDHPLLEPVAACRMCLVDIEGVPKPQPACAQVVSDGMQVRTQLTSPIARDAQEGVMEFLLLNHPLDCPVCDKGGECPLQNQAMSAGRPESRFEGEKRTFPKPINVSAQILLDRERCVSCARCTRFAEQIAGDPMLELLERGVRQQVGTAADQPFDSYFSGNTVQICPVGALTSAAYRFRSRPFDLVSVPTTCEHCASGCSLRTDHRRGTVTRRLAWDEPAVNEEWNCDKGRFAFTYQELGRVETPLIREDGQLRVASWPEALDFAARGLAAASSHGVLVGGRSTIEDAYAYARFARVALKTDNIDFRVRDSSDEEAQFLRSSVAGTAVRTTYETLEKAPVVVLIAFEPEDESPIVFLRLRKAARGGTRIYSVGAAATRGLAKMRGTLIPAKPGAEAAVLAELAEHVRVDLSTPGAVIMVGERIAGVEGGATAVLELARATGAALTWVPRRAGERGALDAGALAGLLPGGRPLTDDSARGAVAAAWGVDSLPATVGLAGTALLTAARDGAIGALITAGVELADLPDQILGRTAIEAVGFVVALENHHSAVTELADVVFPVAVVTEKSGTFINWEGRPRPFAQAFKDALVMSDAVVLGMLASAMNIVVGASDVAGIRRELGALGAWPGPRAEQPSSPAGQVVQGAYLVATWRELIDSGVMQEGEPYLAATAHAVAATVSVTTAGALGNPELVTVTGPLGSVTVSLQIGDVVDGVVCLPLNSPGCALYRDLGVRSGQAVTIEGAV
ncbi:MAG: NADH-quinone oxidoreductase subunit G [Actinomycetota bacterium]|nr:NADH-quinone oxidoreductase subunit G [Actinomycetota bacterium]